MIRIVLAVWFLLFTGTAEAQQWFRYYGGGYGGGGTYRQWPTGWYGFNPGYRYYGPGAFQPWRGGFGGWQRNPGYRY